MLHKYSLNLISYPKGRIKKGMLTRLDHWTWKDDLTPELNKKYIFEYIYEK